MLPVLWCVRAVVCGSVVQLEIHPPLALEYVPRHVSCEILSQREVTWLFIRVGLHSVNRANSGKLQLFVLIRCNLFIWTEWIIYDLGSYGIGLCSTALSSQEGLETLKKIPLSPEQRHYVGVDMGSFATASVNHSGMIKHEPQAHLLMHTRNSPQRPARRQVNGGCDHGKTT